MRKRLTEKQRHAMCAFVLTVGLTVMPMSLSLLLTTIYVRFIVDDELDLVQGMNTATLPYFLAVTGTINFLSNLLLLSSIARVLRLNTRAQTMRLVFVSTIIALVATTLVLAACIFTFVQLGLPITFVSTIIALVATSLVFAACIFTFVQLAMLSGDFKEGLIRAMKQYQTVPSVKARMDILQIDYACCGDNGYKDWFSVAWVSGDILVADPKEVQINAPAELEYKNDDVPFSCCDPASPRPCIHHHITTDYLHYNYDHRTNTTLYTAGCREALMNFFGHTLLRSIALCLLFIFLAQVALLVVSRLLHTSMQGAITKGNPTAPAEGYLFKLPVRAKRRSSKDDPESGNKDPLLGHGGDTTTDTEGGNTTDTEPTSTSVTPSSGDGSPRRSLPLPPSSATPATEPEYDDIGPPSTLEEEPVYENILPGHVMDVNMENQHEVHYENIGQPLFPSEMAGNQAQNNSATSARRRGSRAFNSLGIFPLNPPPSRSLPPPPPPPPPLPPSSLRY